MAAWIFGLLSRAKMAAMNENMVPASMLKDAFQLLYGAEAANAAHEATISPLQAENELEKESLYKAIKSLEVKAQKLEATNQVSEARISILHSHLANADTEAAQLRARNAVLDFELDMTAQLAKASTARTAELCRQLYSADRTIATQSILLRGANVIKAKRDKEIARLQRTVLVLEQEADEKLRSMAKRAKEDQANAKVLSLAKQLDAAQEALPRRPQQSEALPVPIGQKLSMSRTLEEGDEWEEREDWEPRVLRERNGVLLVKGPTSSRLHPGRGSTQAAKLQEEIYVNENAAVEDWPELFGSLE